MAGADEPPIARTPRSRWLHRAAALLALGLAATLPGCACAPSECPKDDEDPCTVDTCESGSPVHEYLGDGHPCFRGALDGRCNAGVCEIKCETWKDCEDGNPCTLSECQAGRCIVINNDYATAPLDGNDCTHDSCLDGQPFYWPMPDGTVCADDLGTCSAGVCSKCQISPDCGITTECLTWTCEKETCIAYPRPPGTPVYAEDVAGDCRRPICDGSGNVIIEADPSDAPLHADTCFAWKCLEWTPVQEVTIHGPCVMSTGELGYCEESGSCIQCLFDNDCKHANDRCFEGMCVNCGNGIQDGDETGKDCGGSCGACNGTPCEQPTECATLNCAYTNVVTPDRVCCDFPCDGVCEQCGLDGKCGPVPTGQQDKITCSDFDEACAGILCKTKAGYPCQFNSNCISSICDPVTKLCK